MGPGCFILRALFTVARAALSRPPRSSCRSICSAGGARGYSNCLLARTGADAPLCRAGCAGHAAHAGASSGSHTSGATARDQKGPAMRLGPTLAGTLAVLAISSSVEQNLVRDPWRHPALFVFGPVRDFWLRLAAFAHDPASIRSGQVRCLICLWLRLVRQLGMQRMQQQWLSLRCLSLSAPLGCPHLQATSLSDQSARK